MKRRDFLVQFGASSLLAYLSLESCRADQRHYTVREASNHSKMGHLLRETFAKPANPREQTTDVLIVGGGISGLSAARYLQQHTDLNFLMLEMADTAGGNAMKGANSISSFPWAAHYLPIPSPSNKDLIDFLQEIGVITQVKDGMPHYNEDYLCFDPKERLFLHGKWQEGLIPHFNLSQEDRKQIDQFMAFMHQLRHKKDSSGAFYFSIPLHLSSTENELIYTHSISAKEWLEANGYSSPYLHWYINYCTSDDYGSSYAQTSAWAMFHYFASRRGEAENATYDDVLTWPEGNAFLAERLIKPLAPRLHTNEIALHIEQTKKGVSVFHQHTQTGEWTKTNCRKLILNTPFHVVKKLIPSFDTDVMNQHFQSYPWIVANISLTHLPEKITHGLSWDNVIYNSGSLGFILANHQSLKTHLSDFVFTYYKALNRLSAKDERIQLMSKPIQVIRQEIVAELKTILPDVEKYIVEMEIKKIGHGMISPRPGLLTSSQLKEFNKPFGHIYFVHTDFCGISIFEEAFARGISVAKQILNL
jgi:monoamine oxidase